MMTRWLNLSVMFCTLFSLLGSGTVAPVVASAPPPAAEGTTWPQQLPFPQPVPDAGGTELPSMRLRADALRPGIELAGGPVYKAPYGPARAPEGGKRRTEVVHTAQPYAPSGVVRYVAPTGSDSGDCANSASPCATVQYAVDVSDTGDEIRVATGVYTDIHARLGITQVAYISKTVAIRGGYTTADWTTSDPEAHPTVLDAQGQGRVLYISGDIAPVVEGLHITGGGAEKGGGVYVITATATISNCRITGNTAGGGGGVYLEHSEATLSGNTISSNTASGGGGGVFLSGSTAVTLSGNTIQGNTADGSGGGVYLSKSTATLSGNIIQGNAARGTYWDGGGGVFLYSSDATLSRNTIISNTANEDGGGVYLYGGVATLSGNTISGNTAYYHGGGVCLYGGAATLSGNTLSGNTAHGSGGGVHLDGGAATLSGNTLSSNTADYYGGGVFLFDSDVATLSGNTISSNTASRSGGGVYLSESAATLSGNTLIGNAANDYGGGVCLYSSDATLDNNVIADNQAASGGTGVYIEGSTSRLRHNTIARNTGGNGSGVYVTYYYVYGKYYYSRVWLTNTILGSHSVGISVTGGSTVTVNAVLWYGTPITVSHSPTAAVFLQNQYTGDPAFVNPAGGDYHIQSTSAAVNRGVTVDVPLDIDDDYRPSAAPPDLGADEVIPSPPQCKARLNGNTYTTVQAALDAASPGDTVEVAGVCEDAVTWNGATYVAVLTKEVTLKGGYSLDFNTWDPANHPTVLNGHGRGGVLAVGSGISPTVEYLTLLGGEAAEGGGVWSAGAGPVLRHLQVAHNIAGRGGGLYLGGPGGRLEESVMEQNRAAQGGGLYLAESAATVVSNTVEANVAGSGGGVYLDRSAATLGGNTVISNTANGDGGGVYLYGSDATLSGNTISGNTAQYGGGMYLHDSDATLSGNTVSSNTASSSGGGMYLSSSKTTLSGNAVQGNTANNGGGVYLSTSDAALSENTISGNTASNEGGGLYLDYSAATLSGNTVSSNTALYGGGGYLNYSAATLSGNTISGNTVKYHGGGVYLNYSDATLSGNIIQGNTANVTRWGGGGGVYLYDSDATLSGNTIQRNTARYGGGMHLSSSDATLNGNTVSGNTADVSGGGGYLSSSDATLSGNTIINNTALYGGGVYLSGSDATLTNNFIAGNAIGSGGRGAGVRVVGGTSRFIHNTIASNSGGDGSGLCVASNVALTNTILVNHAVGISVTAGSTATVNAVLWYGNGANTDGAGSIQVSNEHTGDPAFVDPTGGDYHIQSTSAAVDAGVDAGVTVDIDGDRRPHGAGYDIGADECYACRSVSEVTISGPTSGITGATYTFKAVVAPPDATPPITYTWTPTPANGQGTANATYTWATTGTQVITVTVRNCGGVVTDTYTIYIFPHGELIAVSKTVAPTGAVAYGDELTYTLVISGAPGASLGLYDPLEGTTFLRFVEPVTGVVHSNGVITGTVTLTPTAPVTVSFVARVGVPGTAGWTVDVSNRACVYPAGGTLGECVWSNEVTNEATHLYAIYLPLVVRGR